MLAGGTEAAEPLSIGVAKKETLGPSPTVALILAIAVGVGVFALLMKLRKTFGMKE